MQEVTTRLHACSIECLWRDNVFACGTYELNEVEKVRDGEIVVFEGTHAISTTICESGVLDMKYARSKLCVALSHGALLIFSVDTAKECGGVGLDLLTRERSASLEDEGLFLSVDIDLRLSETCWSVRTLLMVSTQAGSVLVYAYDPTAAEEATGSLTLLHRTPSAHTMLGEDMPAWIAFFNPHTSKRVVSGGDDMVMKVWDLPENNEEVPNADEQDVSDLPALLPASLSRNRHTAGVTSGQWHPVHSDIFATGSYDEYVRVWDQGNVAAPLLKLHTGGGVWRVKWWVPTEGSAVSFLVLACMHGGCRVYRLAIQKSADERGAWTVAEANSAHTIDSRNPKHLAYGIDVLACAPVANANAEEEEELYELTLGLCSFYDNLVQIWKIVL